MQSFISSTKALRPHILHHHNTTKLIRPTTCDVFINHRGIDTKRNVAGLLYDHLTRLNLKCFLDSKNMKPGDKLFQNIETAILNSKIGLAVFSPRYCLSYFCLHELALLIEANKKVIPIFCDVKPSQLCVRDNRSCPKPDLERFQRALEEAKYTVGIDFDSSSGDWPGLLRNAADVVMENLLEVEKEI